MQRVIVVAPQQFQVIRRSVKKTDKHDAAALALFLPKDLLPEARVKDARYQQLHSLCATRDQLVKLKTSLIGKVHGILTQYGIKEKREKLTTHKRLQTALKHEVSTAEQIELRVIVEQVEHLNGSIKKLEGAIQDAAKGLPGYEGLTSIKGIGERSAAVFLRSLAISRILPGPINSRRTWASYHVWRRVTRRPRPGVLPSAAPS